MLMLPDLQWRQPNIKVKTKFKTVILWSKFSHFHLDNKSDVRDNNKNFNHSFMLSSHHTWKPKKIKTSPDRGGGRKEIGTRRSTGVLIWQTDRPEHPANTVLDWNSNLSLLLAFSLCCFDPHAGTVEELWGLTLSTSWSSICGVSLEP